MKHSFWEAAPSSWVEHTVVSQIVLTSLILVLFETSTRNKQDSLLFNWRCPVVQKWSLGKAKKADSAKQSRGKRINFQITRLFYISFLLKRCRSLSMRDFKVSKRKCFLVSLNCLKLLPSSFSQHSNKMRHFLWVAELWHSRLYLSNVTLSIPRDLLLITKNILYPCNFEGLLWWWRWWWSI